MNACNLMHIVGFWLANTIRITVKDEFSQRVFKHINMEFVKIIQDITLLLTLIVGVLRAISFIISVNTKLLD